MTQHTYTLSELRDGTGFAPDARFVQVPTQPPVVQPVRTMLDWSDPIRDKYGRATVHLDRIHIDATGRWVERDRHLAVVVTMPKSYTEAHPTDRYLLNVRKAPSLGNPAGLGDVSYHKTRKAAQAAAEVAV